MKQILTNSLLLLFLLGTMACQKPSNNNAPAAPPINPDFIGTWSVEALSSTESNDKFDRGSEQMDENVSSEKNSAYMLIKVDANYNVIVESLGLQSGVGKIQTEVQTTTGMKLNLESSSTGSLFVGPDALNQMRARGVSETTLQEGQQNPCKIILTTPMTAQYSCAGVTTPVTNALIKLNDADVATLQASTREYFAESNRVRSSLAKKLGGTSWTLVESKIKTRGSNGRYSERRDNVSNGSDINSTLNANAIAFSQDLQTSRINNTYLANVILRPLKDRSRDTAQISFRILPKAGAPPTLSQSGVVQLSEDRTRLTLSEGYKYGGTQIQKTTTYKRAR